MYIYIYIHIIHYYYYYIIVCYDIIAVIMASAHRGRVRRSGLGPPLAGS